VGNVRSGDEELKTIPICDLFHRIAVDTAFDEYSGVKKACAVGELCKL
jgi:hypothetical protein